MMVVSNKQRLIAKNKSDARVNPANDDNLEDIDAVEPILHLISSDAEINDAVVPVVPVVNNDVMNEVDGNQDKQVNRATSTDDDCCNKRSRSVTGGTLRF